MLLVWFVATMAYVVMDLTIPAQIVKWLPFAYAMPVSMVVWLVFNSIWFNRRRNYFIISMLMWTGLVCVVLTVGAFGVPVWKLLYLGIPGQIAIIAWSCFKKKNTKK